MRVPFFHRVYFRPGQLGEAMQLKYEWELMKRDTEATVMMIVVFEHVSDELGILESFVEIRTSLVRAFFSPPCDKNFLVTGVC